MFQPFKNNLSLINYQINNLIKTLTTYDIKQNYGERHDAAFNSTKDGASNPNLKSVSYANLKLECCVVKYAHPSRDYYEVAPIDGHTGSYSMKIGTKTTCPWDVKTYKTIPPGTYVLVLKDQDLSKMSYFVSFVDRNNIDKATTHPIISPVLCSGELVDSYYTTWTKNDIPGLPSDIQRNTPLDLTCLGDTGLSSSTHGLIHVDPFMITAKLNEMCGLWLFLINQLTRLSGQNLEIDSQVSNESLYNAEGIPIYYKGITNSINHVLGSLVTAKKYKENHNSKAYSLDLNTAESTDIKDTTKLLGVIEPKELNIIDWYDFEDMLLPYSGGLSSSMIHAVIEKNKQFLYTEQNQPFQTLNNITKHSDGVISISSTTGIKLYKTPFIPNIKLNKYALNTPNKDCFDTIVENYNTKETFKSQSNGLDYILNKDNGFNFYILNKKQKNIENDNNTTKTKVYTTTSDEQIKNNTTSVYRNPDTNIESVKESTSNYTNDLTRLKEHTILPFPPFHYIPTETKDTNTKVFNSTSGISFEEDGSVVLSDGYGASITMSGGNIYLDAPGDIMIRSGRTGCVMSGHDTIIKSYNSTDITSSTKDVRIKAEHNLEMLSGNDGNGRTLIENKATSSPKLSEIQNKTGEDVDGKGICLKCEDSAIINYATDIINSASNITNVAENTCTTKCDISRTFYSSYITMCSTNQDFINNSVTISTSGLEVAGKGTFTGNIATAKKLSCNNVEATNTITAGNIMLSVNGYVTGGALAHLKQDKVTAPTLDDSSYMDNYKTDQQKFLNNEFVNKLQRNGDDYGYLSEEFVSANSFTYRTDEQYGTKNYITPMPPWRVQLDSWSNNWKETVDTTRELAPYPGYKATLEKSTLVTVAPTKENAKDTSTVYKTTSQILDNNFPIMRVKTNEK